MARRSVFRNPHLDGTTFYLEAGSAGVLLLHGLTATTTEVRLLGQVLHSQGYTVSGPLLPGHGTSPSDCNRYSWQDWLSAAGQAYRQLADHCQQVVVGGESMGALLALHLAVMHRGAAAVLCYAPAMRYYLSRAEILLTTFLVPFVESIPKAPSTDNNPWKGYTVNPLRAAYQLLRLQKATSPLLPQVRQPLLVMQGRLDPTAHPLSPQVIYEGVSSSIKELHWLEDSAHCVILDKERDLAAKLTINFLARVLN